MLYIKRLKKKKQNQNLKQKDYSGKLNEEECERVCKICK